MKAKFNDTSSKSEWYDTILSGEAFTPLLINLSHQKINTKSLEILLNPLEPELRSMILDKFEMMHVARITMDDLATILRNEPGAKLSQHATNEQINFLKTVHDDFSRLLVEATVKLSTASLIELVELMYRCKIMSHTVFRAAISKIMERVNELSAQQFRQIVGILYSLVPIYSLVDGQKVKLANSTACIEEILITEFLNTQQLSKFCTKAAEEITFKEFQIDATVATQLIYVLNKFLKVSHLRTANKNLLFSRFCANLYKNMHRFPELSTEALKTLNGLCAFLSAVSFFNPLLFRVFQSINENLWTRNLSPLYKSSLLVTSLSFFSNSGMVCDKIWTKYMRPEAFKILSKKKNEDSTEIVLKSILGFMGKTQFKDPELLTLSLHILNRLFPTWESLNRISLFNFKEFHQSLQMIYHFGMMTNEQVQLGLRLINSLATICLCRNNHRTPEHLPEELPQSLGLDSNDPSSPRVIVCCQSEDSAKVVLANNPTPSSEEMQFFHDNYNEMMTKEALEHYAHQYFDTEMTVLTDKNSIQACIYRWDMILKFADTPHKIGLEIVGDGYRSLENIMVQKKKAKLMLMERFGFIPVVYDVTTSSHKFANMAIDVKSIAALLTDKIIKDITAKTGTSPSLAPGMEEKLKADLEELEKKKNRLA